MHFTRHQMSGIKTIRLLTSTCRLLLTFHAENSVLEESFIVKKIPVCGKILDFYLNRFWSVYLNAVIFMLQKYQCGKVTVGMFCVVLQYGYLTDPPGVDLEDVETSENALKVVEVQCQLIIIVCLSGFCHLVSLNVFKLTKMALYVPIQFTVFCQLQVNICFLK